ncbi:MAG: Cellulase [Chloroflexi bacterium]|nr:Cellulase [Chloroflexota bacterium]
MNFDLLKRLCETPSVPGREEALRATVREIMEPLVDELRVDALGNVIGTKRGNGKRKVMLAAHMDEIGFLVKFIDKKGFIRLQPVGGFDPRTLVAQRVLVHTAAGPLRGALMPGVQPIHLMQGDPKPLKLEEFFVDVGLTADEVKERVELGDPVTMDRTTERLGNCVISKSLDDRLSLYVMFEALKAVKSHEVDIVAVATVQEEVGLRGAGPAAYSIQPDIGVALDITLAVDIPGNDEELAVTRLGEGAAIKIMDGSSISHPKLVQHFKEIAKREGIPHQLEILPRGGTDAGTIQPSRGGIPSITLSTPTRYVHTVNESAHERDIQAAVDLLARYLEQAHTSDISY